MSETKRKKGKAVLVVGGGAAGIRASLDLAEMGHKVYLCDRKPSLGGVLVHTDRWFPDNHCGMCKMLPIFSRDDKSQFCLRSGLVHPNIELLPMTEFDSVTGEAGDFTVTVKSAPAGVNPELCVGCGTCNSVCPVEVPDEFNEGLSQRKAIYLRTPWLPSNSYVIDWAACTKCGECVAHCPTKAINLSPQGSSKKISVGSIILSTGIEQFNTEAASQYGHGRYPNVLTSIELERLLSQSGPTEGVMLRPSDKKVPQSVAFLQCVGSRDMKRNYCSFACCMYALKEAMLIKKLYPQVEVEIFYMDMRVFGKGYHRYYEQAKAAGIKFTRCRVPLVKQDFQNGDLIITTAGEDNSLKQRRFNMLVLSVGQVPSPLFQVLADPGGLGIKLNQHGFCQTGEFTPVETSTPGVFVCGSASGPKNITDSMIGASAAAGKASHYAISVEWPENGGPSNGAGTDFEIDAPAKTAVLLCDCGNQISSIIDMEDLLDASRALPSVVYAERAPYLCMEDALASIRPKMDHHGANRVVLASCAPFLTRRLGASIDLDPSLIQVVNLREEVAWPNQENPVAATDKARALISMAVERLRLQQPAVMLHIAMNQSALVVGSGLAAMVAARTISDFGYEVHIVSREPELGGRARNIRTTLSGSDVPAFLEDLRRTLANNPDIHQYKGVEIATVEGHAGNFHVILTSTVADPSGKDLATSSLEVGSIVLAMGADELRPTEYLYGQNDKVITQTELEARLNTGDLGDVKSVAMVQCVGSRDEDRPYCGRICCAEALLNALRIKEANPHAEVVIFYRDMMSYGLMEADYKRAREKGVLFVRYDPERKPEVKAEGGKLRVTVRETALPRNDGNIVMEPDLLVLSVPLVPRDQTALAAILGLELTEDGFFKEAEVKFRPVDCVRDGIFICGLAHSPRGMAESITQAQAAGQRAASIMAKGRLMSGRTVSEVKARWCAGCQMCVDICPYNARVMDESEGVVMVLEALCQGCGTCVVSCPSGAAGLRGLSDKQIMSMVDAAL